jgi:hypothetical protein
MVITLHFEFIDMKEVSEFVALFKGNNPQLEKLTEKLNVATLSLEKAETSQEKKDG